MRYRDGQTTALITGITGQDGSYLAELLLKKGYRVFGLIRRTSNANLSNLKNIIEQVDLIRGDLTDPHSLKTAINFAKPDEIYHLGAQTYVGTSWEEPLHTAQVTGLGTLNMLEAIRQTTPHAKFYQASSSEQFGKASPPQSESTVFHPRSPYGVAKCYAHNITVNYRESYELNASCGILFNHESPRRGLEFVTRKVTHTAAAIKLGLKNDLRMGNLDAQRDWGHAKDYVEAMWLMLRQPTPDDYVIATGTPHSVQDLVEIAFDAVELDWKEYYRPDPKFFRPAEVHYLCGDASKAHKVLKWEPTITFEEMIEDMVYQDLRKLENQVGTLQHS